MLFISFLFNCIKLATNINTVTVTAKCKKLTGKTDDANIRLAIFLLLFSSC